MICQLIGKKNNHSFHLTISFGCTDAFSNFDAIIELFYKLCICASLSTIILETMIHFVGAGCVRLNHFSTRVSEGVFLEVIPLLSLELHEPTISL